MLKLVMTGVVLIRVTDAVALPVSLVAVAAWVAVIVMVPDSNMVTVEPETVAMLVFELEYEKAPVPLEDGSVIEKVAPLT